MLSVIHSPLVAGSTASPMANDIRYVRVVRAFYSKGEVQPVGTIVELPSYGAAEVIASGKAVPAEKPAPVVEKAPEAPKVKVQKNAQ